MKLENRLKSLLKDMNCSKIVVSLLVTNEGIKILNAFNNKGMKDVDRYESDEYDEGELIKFSKVKTKFKETNYMG